MFPLCYGSPASVNEYFCDFVLIWLQRDIRPCLCVCNTHLKYICSPTEPDSITPAGESYHLKISFPKVQTGLQVDPRKNKSVYSF